MISLFAAGVLEFLFAKKRWPVKYGLDLSRSMLAVPYHAKDNVSKSYKHFTFTHMLTINSLAERQVRIQPSRYSHRPDLSVLLLRWLNR